MFLFEKSMGFRELADYDMLCCMIDENNTQQSITPKIVFENVTAAIVLAERFLNETENVNDFNDLVKSSSLSGRKGSIFWPPSQYGQAKSAISENGDGLGVFLIKQFMPSPPKDETIQSVIDSYYSVRRKVVAEKRKAAELDAARIADEERFYLKKVWVGLVPEVVDLDKTSTLFQATYDPCDLLPMKRISIRIAVSTFLQLFCNHLKAADTILIELDDFLLKTPSFRTGRWITGHLDTARCFRFAFN